MLFTAHLFDTNPLTALRRSAPKPGAGLLQARNAVAAPFTHGMVPRPQLGREVILASWEDEHAVDRFLENDPLGQAMAQGWHVRLELVRAVGMFPGLDVDLKGIAGDKEDSMTGPSVAFTLGHAYLKTMPQFLKVNKGLERQFLKTPDAIWGTAMTNLRTRFVSTLTFWESLDAATNYMKSGAHGAAVRNHYDPQKDPTGHNFVTGGGFLGFRPLSISGSVGGSNPVSESLLEEYVA